MEVTIIIVAIILVVAARLMWSSYLANRQREMMHRERMAAIEKGIDAPTWPEELVKSDESAIVTLYRERAATRTHRHYLLRGLVWFFLGVALTVSLWGISETSRHQIVPRWYYEVPMDQRTARPPLVTENEMPLGFAGLGLIPTGIGMAYLLFYLAESRKLKSEV